MAGSFAQIGIDDRKIADRFRELVKRVEHPRTALLECGESLIDITRQHFSNMAEPDGTPWQALSKSYQKRKKINKGRILVLHGYLMGQLIYQVPDDHTLLWGSNRLYAAAMQFGLPERNIPPRPFVGFGPAEKKAVLSIWDDYLTK